MSLRPVGSPDRRIVVVVAFAVLCARAVASQLMLDDVKIERITYGAIADAYRLSNSTAALVVAPTLGGRIVSYHLRGAANVLWEQKGERGKPAGVTPSGVGGFSLHPLPLFISAEASPRQPASWQVRSLDHNEIRLLGPPDERVDAQLILELKLYPHSARVRLRERVRNLSAKPLRLALKSAALAPPGGIVTVPRNAHSRFPQGVWVAPDSGRTEAPPWALNGTTISVRTDADIGTLGADSTAGWVSYQRADQVFVRTFAYRPEVPYPAGGCSVLLSSASPAMEIALLSPVSDLPPHGEAMFVEEWSLQQMQRKTGR